MSENFLLAIDQGTTGSTALIVDKDGLVRSKITEEFPQHFPRPGWVEHDLNEIWTSVLKGIDQAIRKAEILPQQICGIGITNQRETTCLWDRKTLVPSMRAIVWQCKRSESICHELRTEENVKLVREKTGLVIDPYFSATKLNWIFKEDRTLKDKAQRGNLCFGTIDSFLVAMLTGGANHVTDVTNASRTLLFNIHSLEWDEELCRLFDIPKEVLPKVVSCSETVGKTRGLPILPDGIPICGIMGDQQAALFGQACLEKGMGKCTYGTGAFMLTNTGSKPVASQNGLLTTIAWKHQDRVCYALEGAAFIAGAAVQWLRDKLHLINSATEIEDLAKETSSSGSVVFVPAMSGLGAPYWEPNAKAALLGISRDTSGAHIARAVLEGIANQNRDILHSMELDMDGKITELRVDGGAAANHLLMQYQADILDIPIHIPQTLESTALGAAFSAGLALGIWPDFSAIQKTWKVQRTFVPEMPKSKVKFNMKKWKLGIKAVLALKELQVPND